MTAKSNKAVTDEQMRAALEPLKRDLELMKGEIEKMRQSVYGNGEVGMDEIVRDLKKKMEFMIRVTYFVFTIIGGYILVEVLKFLIQGIAK